MSGNHHGHRGEKGPHETAGPDARGPYWRRVHRSWVFWVGVLLFVVAMAIYVSSVDLSLVPRPQHQSRSS